MITLMLILLAGCAGGSEASSVSQVEKIQASTEKELIVPIFSGDSAYKRVKEQVGFGPRVPGSEAHSKTVDYIINELNAHHPDTVEVQRANVGMPDGKPQMISNIMARWGTDKKSRILILAHYDTRPVADRDEDQNKRSTPIDGANDGASGVAVMLELARLIDAKAPDNIGVDMLFVDAEDSGVDDDELSWCIGTQYWVKNSPYNQSTKPKFAILLDMVGGRDARFHREYFSDKYARRYVDKIWSRAAVEGFSSRFINESGSAITDDHVFLNRAGIPTVDIIENCNPATGSFNPSWHTLDDNIANIDPATLDVVGRTVAAVIYNEK